MSQSICLQAVTGYNEHGVAIPLEPFNLSREREEGYFDADGSYIEYRLDEMKDAWLEGLADVRVFQALNLDLPVPLFDMHVHHLLVLCILGPDIHKNRRDGCVRAAPTCFIGEDSQPCAKSSRGEAGR